MSLRSTLPKNVERTNYVRRLTYLLPLESLPPPLELPLDFSGLAGVDDVLEAALPPSLLAAAASGLAEEEDDEAGELLRA